MKELPDSLNWCEPTTVRDNLYKYQDCPTTKDHCAGCEHPEVIRMLIPRLEELERRITELEMNRINDLELKTERLEKHLINAFKKIETLAKHSL